MWYLTRAREATRPFFEWRNYLYGKVIKYVLVNDFGVWAWSEVVNDWRCVDLRLLELLLHFDCLSELEALVILGLHDENANRIMYNEKHLES